MKESKILCSYGCGQEAKHQFKNGKWCCESDWKRCSVKNNEISKRIRQPHSQETKNKISQGRKGKMLGSDHPMFGKSHSEESKEKIRQSRLGTIHSKETRLKLSRILKNRKLSVKHIESIRRSKLGEKNPFYGKKHSEETRDKISKKVSGINNPMYGKKHTIESNKKNSESNKRIWADPKSVFNSDEFRFNLSRSLNIRPNKPESELIEILNNFLPDEYIYTGDFSFWIGRKNPDFICEKKKKIIEFFGNYWHEDYEEDERIDYFKTFGYETLIIWESDYIKNQTNIINKIIEFHKEN